MSSTERNQYSPSEGLRIPGLVQSQEPVEQLSFGASQTPLAGPQSSPDLADLETTRQPVAQVGAVNPSTPTPLFEPGSTRALLMQSQPVVTRALTEALAQPGTVARRPPLIIKGDSGKTRGFQRPPQGRRHVISIAALLLLLIITGGMLLAVSPLGHEGRFSINPLNWGSNLVKSDSNNNLSLVVQATATAVYHRQNDGYDPNASGGPVVTGSPHYWAVGYCTYWANSRYHTLTSNWVTWTGNAYQWVQGARLAGWNVSSTPHVPSIIVLQPGVQGASSYGHVAVVESINADGSAHTSNMNWYVNGGGWDRVSYYDFTAGNGVSFIWK